MRISESLIDNKNILLFIINTLLSLLILFISYNIYISPDAIANIKLFSIISLIYFPLIITIWGLMTKELFNIYNIILLFSFVFYFGQPIAFLIDNNSGSYGVVTFTRISLEAINYSLLFIICSFTIIDFFVKAIYLLRKSLIVKSKNDYRIPMKYTGYILLLISIVPTMITFSSNILVALQGGYSDLFSSNIYTSSGFSGGYIRVLSNYLEPALLLLIISNIDNKKSRNKWILLSFIYILLNYFVGIRGQSTLYIISLILIYHYLIKKVTYKKLAFVSLFGVFFAVLLRYLATIRNISRQDKSLFQIVEDSWSQFINDSPLISTLYEFGQTLVSVGIVFEKTPDTIPYNYGFSYINSFFAMFPNLFWDVHPAVKSGSMDSIFSGFVTGYGGLGGSFISEAYYNFGLYSLAFMSIIGIFIAFLYTNIVKSASRKDLLVFFIFIYITKFILWYIRSETFSFWRNTLYYVLIPCCLVLIINSLLINSNKYKKRIF
ncbi:O-antigen polysaccharide polymerase Wzy [Sporosarcina sp. 6E9]|uniref:O-antigen polysaccharide polymerase Wzy n=1 Tax=Sporosarcina sp. 6E9 TaxID=2819235 RepID=UPI001B304BBF|nr:O-antigen polysaccharide polymerase Wzy [Sporosarcina sp. 6E9]